MNLRPHHLLCTSTFVGKGYDDAFADHMSACVGRLHGGCTVTLTRGCDELCSACPHNVGGVCDQRDRVMRLDAGVLAASGLRYGMSAPWAELAAVAGHAVFDDRATFMSVCGVCQWCALCRAVLDGNCK